MMTASITSTVDTSAAVAALAALGAVWFARSTVLEAVAGRRESRQAHADEMRELRAERQSAAERHEAEMRDRAAAFEAELAMRRLAQLEAISTLMLHMVEVARAEYFEPPPVVDVTEGLGQMVTTTRLPAIRSRLDAAVAAFNKLGGTNLEVKLPEPGRGEKAASLRAWTDGIALLPAIEELVRRERAPRELADGQP